MSTKTLPTILSYPDVLPIEDLKSEMKDKLVYAVEAYPTNGVSALISRSRDDVNIQVSDWHGKPIDPQKILNFMTKHSRQFVTVMRTIRLPQAQFYMYEDKTDLVLVDIRISANKFAGPGMLKELFAKVIRTQKETMKPFILDEEAFKNIHGRFNNTILKTSSFKTIVRGNDIFPLYGVVKSNAASQANQRIQGPAKSSADQGVTRLRKPGLGQQGRT